MLELIEQSLQDSALTVHDICALASIDLKSHEPGLLELAQLLGVPLTFFSATQLAPYEPQLSHRSAISLQHTGCMGVAESAALALASQSGPAKLRISRQKNTQATFALAICLPTAR